MKQRNKGASAKSTLPYVNSWEVLKIEVNTMCTINIYILIFFSRKNIVGQ